jgi:hypothetical protein
MNIVHGSLTGVSVMSDVTIACLTLYQANVLISRSQRACLADFAVAETGPISTTSNPNTLRRQAPELLLDMQKSAAAVAEPPNTWATDVHAFALVCYTVGVVRTFSCKRF